jgi:hypothetical protein
MLAGAEVNAEGRREVVVFELGEANGPFVELCWPARETGASL